MNALSIYRHMFAVPDLRKKILFTLATQKAWFTRGFGCTLAKDRPSLGEATKVVADTNPLTEAPAPEPDAEVDAAIAKAFGDDLAKLRR